MEGVSSYSTVPHNFWPCGFVPYIAEGVKMTHIGSSKVSISLNTALMHQLTPDTP